jgi:hypothetical protein
MEETTQHGKLMLLLTREFKRMKEFKLTGDIASSSKETVYKL